jgi:hypothetical protein
MCKPHQIFPAGTYRRVIFRPRQGGDIRAGFGREATRFSAVLKEQHARVWPGIIWLGTGRRSNGAIFSSWTSSWLRWFGLYMVDKSWLIFVAPRTILRFYPSNPTITDAACSTERSRFRGSCPPSVCSEQTPVVRCTTGFYGWVHIGLCRSQWPRGLRRGSSAVRLLGLRVRIPEGAWMSVSSEWCVFSGRGLYNGLITRPEKLLPSVVCQSDCEVPGTEKAMTRKRVKKFPIYIYFFFLDTWREGFV